MNSGNAETYLGRKVVSLQEVVGRAVAYPDEALCVLDRIDSEESLLAFAQLSWPVLHRTRPMTSGWALEAVAEHLEAVARGEIKNLLINIPPSCTKSLMTGVFFPAWVWGPLARSDRRFVSWSYNEALPIRQNQYLRRLVASPWYQARWGDRVSMVGDQNEKRLFENEAGGFSFASGVLGGGTGYHGDFRRVDDPHKVMEAESDVRREEVLGWVAETLTTRETDADAATVIVMQRVHERDVSGFILSQELDYEHLCLPMRYEPDHPSAGRVTSIGFRDPRTEDGELLWPERFSEERVKSMERAMSSWGGSYAVASQLQQRPVPRGGGMFDPKKAQILDEVPSWEEIAAVCRGWDLAGSKHKRAAFTAGVKLARLKDGRLVVLDVTRGRWSPHEVEDAIKRTAEDDGKNRVRQSIPQDPGQAGLHQRQVFARLLQGHDVRFSPESGDKEVRARPLAAQWEAGNVWLVRAPWNDAFVRELASFPRGDWKDEVDAATRAYGEVVRATAPSTTARRGPTCIIG